MGIKPHMRTHFVNAPTSVIDTLELPDVTVVDRLDGAFDYIHLFCVSQSEMDETFPNLKAHLRPSGVLWLSWPKGRKLGSDLALPTVISIGYRHGLVESTCLRVDDTWSGLKFTFPKEGKTYANSYGTLPQG
jgi:hypothetical protein